MRDYRSQPQSTSLRGNAFLFLVAIHGETIGPVAGTIAGLIVRPGMTAGSVAMLREATGPVAGIGVAAESITGVGGSVALSSDPEILSSP